MNGHKRWSSRKFIAAVVAFGFTIIATAGYDMPLEEVAAVDGIVAVWILIEGIIDIFKK